MIAPHSDSLCRQVEPHYYEFLSNKDHQLIPEPIIDHIEQCENCRESIKQLEAELSQAAANFESEQSQTDSAVTRMLKAHFAYVGRHVTCSTAKPFLPALLDPALEIRIPTPITVHLHDCQWCSEDLETIQALNLNRKQLHRLSQLFAEEPPQDHTQCSDMRERAKSVAKMDFGGISAEDLKHICKCPVCRGVCYEARQDLCDSLPEYDQSPEFPCESVAVTDIFDYVVPYGLDPISDQYAQFRESLTAHLHMCPMCLAKIQQLHKAVYAISERAESDVVTIFLIDHSAKAQPVGESDDLYAGFPIRVETRRREDESVSTIDVSAALKQKASVMNLKLLVKAAGVAAVILVAVALLLNTPTAKAITIGQIYEALEKATNVHISSFVPGKAEPAQEKWISRALSMYLTKTEKQWVLWDIHNEVRKSKQSDTGVAEIIPLTSDLLTSVERNMSGSLGLTPFDDISEIPPGAEWRHITDADTETPTEDTEVYELTWTKYSGSITFKWRVSVETRTNRPRKTEFYQKLSADSDYILTSIMVVDYVSDNEIQTVIKEVSF